MKHIKKLSMVCVLWIGLIPVALAITVSGFLHAQFGDREEIVIDAIKSDFGNSQVIESLPKDAATGTKTLKIKLARLDPINLPATISYIFGYKCNCLIQVSVVWQLPKKITAKERKEFLTTISDLSRNFAAKPWGSGEILTGRVSGEIKENQTTNYFFFRGVAEDHSAITVWGAPVTIVKAKSEPKRESQQTSLTANIDALETVGVNYELNVKRPDLKRVSNQNFQF